MVPSKPKSCGPDDCGYDGASHTLLHTVCYTLKFYFEVKHSEKVTQRKKEEKKVFINCLSICTNDEIVEFKLRNTWPYI